MLGKVCDKYTVPVMKSFYERTVAGRNAPTTLAEVQKEMLLEFRKEVRHQTGRPTLWSLHHEFLERLACCFRNLYRSFKIVLDSSMAQFALSNSFAVIMTM